MSKLGASKRSALRFAVYIEALGGKPMPFDHRDYRVYAVVLQRQYETLRNTLDPMIVKQAKIAARALIREKTLEVAASNLSPQPSRVSSETDTRENVGYATPIPKEIAEQEGNLFTAANAEYGTRPESLKPGSKDIWNCRRKFRHPHLLSAILHARRLDHEDLNIYPCSVCGGLHVGHNPLSDRAHMRRRARRKLRSISIRLEALRQETGELEKQKKALLKEHWHLVESPQFHVERCSIRKWLRAWLPGMGRRQNLSNGSVVEYKQHPESSPEY